jgi:hypothetical protein
MENGPGKTPSVSVKERFPQASQLDQSPYEWGNKSEFLLRRLVKHNASSLRIR